MVKIFISHQKADSTLATAVAVRLRTYHGIDSYCDVIDTTRSRGEDLADHIRGHMNSCSQLLAVVSSATAASQWVPWEIGVATEKDFPLATFTGESVSPPEFLRKWPYMRTWPELDEYARISISAERHFAANRRYTADSLARSRSTKSFYTELRAALHQ